MIKLKVTAKTMKFLVSRTDKLGDLVLSLSIAKFIKHTHPDSKIFYLVKKGFGDIISHTKHVDGFFEIDTNGDRGDMKPSAFPKLLSFLKKHKFNVCFMLYPKPLLASAVKLGGTKIVGTSRRIFSFLFDFKVNVSRKQNIFHESYYNLLFLSPFFPGVKDLQLSEVLSDLRPEIEIDDKTCKTVKRKFHLPNDYVVFHPFSGGSSPTPSLRYFSRISRHIDIPVVWVGNLRGRLRQQMLNTTLKNIFSPKDISLINKTSLVELTAVLKMSKVVLSPSSGPIHLASALEVPVVGFYRIKDLVRWMPLNPKCEIFDVDDPPEPKLCAKKIEDFCV